MIKTIRIQNFRSLQDVTLNLQDVNLLIGPNNSGKSNLLKAFEFLGDFFGGHTQCSQDKLNKLFFLRKVDYYGDNYLPITFSIYVERLVYRVDFFRCRGHGELACGQFFGKFHEGIDHKEFYNVGKYDLNKLKNIFSDFVIQNYSGPYYDYFLKDSSVVKIVKENIKDNFSIAVKTSGEVGLDNHRSYISFPFSDFEFDKEKTLKHICLRILNLALYSINLSSLKVPYPTLESDYAVRRDASNLVAFLDNMRDNKPDVMDAINTNLNECIKEFKNISFEKVRLPKDHDLRKIHGDKTFKRLGVQDIYGQIYWADELSDGTLYFLALLAIIHQPNPPKLLMIEEPENGIHPRRIKELMDYFFEIAEKQGVQVIMTTHSTVVIDQFTDIPESVFVFDKKGQATTIKNLETDIIGKYEELNMPKLDLSQSLGDHWASGLIGGVPI